MVLIADTKEYAESIRGITSLLCCDLTANLGKIKPQGDLLTFSYMYD